jgi:hypothetical protein
MIIHVLRKPVMGTVAQNALQHGCGALNIDGCRVGYQSDADKASATPQGTCTAKSGALAGGIQNGNDRTEFDRPELKGRWPANLIFSHHPTCVAVGQKKVKGGNDPRAANGTVYNAQNKIYGKINTKYSSNSGYADADGKETITAYKCHNSCPVAALDEQSGITKSTGGSGAASRFFKQFGGGGEIP